eukprot:TRINITY_DN12171_c0_g1_i1.p1 TRINITY_DN12171_c0_g1~~TRINITY_DN12171_c0_g1_i1.p1  ORF type:complete len:199 (+),score=65.98 TRINITY_DN12171_c0_g1_i1:74-670(+)
MVLGDFGLQHDNGFGNCYNKTVDQPCHFRQRPKQAGYRSFAHQQSVGRDQSRPDYGSQQRYACRHQDHNDMLRSGGMGPSQSRASIRIREQPPTALVRNQAIGGTRAMEAERLHVGRKQLPESTAPSVANIADPSQMPPAAHMQRKRDADFSGLRQETMFSNDPNKFFKPPKGKRQDNTRTRRTTGDEQLLQWNTTES